VGIHRTGAAGAAAAFYRRRFCWAVVVVATGVVASVAVELWVHIARALMPKRAFSCRWVLPVGGAILPVGGARRVVFSNGVLGS